MFIKGPVCCVKRPLLAGNTWKKKVKCAFFTKIKSEKVNNFVIVITAGVSKTQDKVGHQETGINVYMVCNTLSFLP